MSGVNGSPSLRSSTPATCQPPQGRVAANGTSHVPLTTSMRATLKSERERSGANRNCPETELRNGPPDPTDEPVSSLRDHVKEICAARPPASRLFAVSSSALYSELPFQTWPSICPKLRLNRAPPPGLLHTSSVTSPAHGHTRPSDVTDGITPFASVVRI